MINTSQKRFLLSLVVIGVLLAFMLSEAYPRCTNARPPAEMALKQFVLPAGTDLVSEYTDYRNVHSTFGIERVYGTNNRLEDEFAVYEQILSRTGWRNDGPVYKGYGFSFHKEDNKNIHITMKEPNSGEYVDIPEEIKSKYPHLYKVLIMSFSPDYDLGECKQQAGQSE